MRSHLIAHNMWMWLCLYAAVIIAKRTHQHMSDTRTRTQNRTQILRIIRTCAQPSLCAAQAGGFHENPSDEQASAKCRAKHFVHFVCRWVAAASSGTNEHKTAGTFRTGLCQRVCVSFCFVSCVLELVERVDTARHSMERRSRESR